MNEQQRLSITAQNEGHVAEWFEASGFQAEKLDKANKERSADWCFSKPSLSVICEVKTIFSGGQSELTYEQHERQFKNRSNRAYITKTIDKEDAFNKFQEDLRHTLENEPRIKHVPFDVVIFSPMHILPRKECTDLVEGVVASVLRAKQVYDQEQPRFLELDKTFSFPDTRRTPTDGKSYDTEIYVFISGPFERAELKIHYIDALFYPYHEDKLRDTIEDATVQLRASKRGEGCQSILILAIWSESSNITLQRFMLEFVDLRKGQLPDRYHLLDWAFEEYHDLGAIVVFEPRYPTHFGLVITNPYLPDVESMLKANITQHCGFTQGLTSNPPSSPSK